MKRSPGTVPVRCAECNKRLYARPSGDGRWAVGRHVVPGTNQKCIGFHRGDHRPIYTRQEVDA